MANGYMGKLLNVDLTTGNVAVANRFTVPVNLVSTDEVGAYVDGSATQSIAVGHAEGVTVSGNFLYLADGPHGVSVWRIANGLTYLKMDLGMKARQRRLLNHQVVFKRPAYFKGHPLDRDNLCIAY